MSVVCCRIYQDRIEFAADSIMVRGWTQEKGKDNFVKLFRKNGLVIGGVGMAEEIALLQLFCRNHKPVTASEESVLEFIVEFINWKNERIDKKTLDNHYLIGYNKKVFLVENFFVKEILEYEAIGAGMDFALAALHLGHDPVLAIGVACELSIFCEQPIQQHVIDVGSNNG